ncbi:proton-conducting membrane transporter [Mesorhizobium sanjuanii]|uniref:Proton-conducting membrane transporter n=1 Tax=Mesorhizobium sanjuanii TaxID=2037900 RepID=A0A2A6FLI3_9HYPH|nr:proton-conducting membrane transporter [Mesorhizobium sanjuanii]PDQ22308.1 proton-conducting membrane transporter [Mesorhizobium sanjuanii]
MGTFFYMLLAFLVGVLVGWFIWGRLRGELDSLRGDLDRTRSERDRLRADSDRLTGELDACGRTRADLERRLAEAQAARTGTAKAAIQAPTALMSTPAPSKPAAAASKTSAAKASTPKASAPKTSAPKAGATKAGASKAATVGAAKTSAAAKKAAPAAKKATAGRATAAAAGKANDLRRLIGIGPANEKLLKGLGVTTYAQIAAWTAADVVRIEKTLNFDGRIERERWIEQAKLLAAGDETEFARRFPTAGTASNT